MNPDIAQTASAVVTFLTPFTPYLVEVGKATGQKWAETVAEKGGEATWNKVQVLWEKIHARFGGDPKVKGAALLVSADPEDTAAQTLLATALERIYRQIPSSHRDCFNSWAVFRLSRRSLRTG